MAYEGYLEVGGIEVVNNERARGYSRTAACPMFWLKDEPCDSLEDALATIHREETGDSGGVYNAADIADAPWFDWTQPDLSSRFYGVFATSIRGLYDSTRTATVTQGIDAGGTIGAERRTTRDIRASVLLLARGQDAVEFGARWLDAALSRDACGRHGSGCGTTDLTYLTNCPPPRIPDFTEDYTEWVDGARNAAYNPAQVEGGALWEVGQRWNWARSMSFSDGGLGPMPGVTSWGRQRATSNATGASTRGIDLYGNRDVGGTVARQEQPVLGGVTYTLSVYAKHELANQETNPLQLQVRIHNGTEWITPIIFAPGTTLSRGEWGRVTATFTPPADGFLNARLAISGSFDQVTNDSLHYWGFQLEEGDEATEVFYGGMPTDTPLERVIFEGAENASPSIFQTRQAIPVPEPDASYYERLDDHRRWLHNVAAISGPTERGELNAGEFWALQMEFVIAAGRPYVYSSTRPVQLPTTPSTVVDDTPRNIVPYPSAELGSGTVVVARNLSTNPSAETNVNGWAAASVGLASGAMSGVSRSTALAAVGAASATVLATMPSAGSDGRMDLGQTIQLPTDPGVRLSFNIWGAVIVEAGAPNLGALEAIAFWRDSGGSVVLTQPVGLIEDGSGSVSLRSVAPPPDATEVVFRVIQRLNSWGANDRIRLFADALAVTVP